MPLLESLYLGHNEINSIFSASTPGQKVPAIRFPEALTYLDLSYNAIGAWLFVDVLPEIFPGLTGLRVAHNPLYDAGHDHAGMGVEESFMLTLARLPRITSLDFSKVRSSAR